MLWVELAVVLLSIFVGSRIGGAGLGLAAAIGLAVLVFIFGLPPSSPPTTVLAIIVAVISAAATMQAAGGMDYLVTVAERVLHSKPRYITLIGPIVAYAFTFCSGTGHVAYAILPVIAEVARKAGVRPERPMSISVIASQQAITASPIAAATAAMLALLGKQGIELWQILVICVPSTLIGVIAGALSVWKIGCELADDPIYQERLKKGLVEPPKPLPTLDGQARRRAVGSVVIFLLAALTIVAFGMFPSLRPSHAAAGSEEQQALAMPVAIQICMYAAAGLMMLLCGAKPDIAVRTSVATAGVIATISIVGLGWLGSCFFEGNRQQIVEGISDIVKAHPWVFAVGLFALSVLLFSQAATVAAMMPVGLALGLSPLTLIAMFPAVNGYFFLPTYGTIVAAVSFDQTGTTRIGKYVLNHSFMLPGLVATITAVVVGLLISRVVPA